LTALCVSMIVSARLSMPRQYGADEPDWDALSVHLLRGTP
jgi:hypothetical protein